MADRFEDLVQGLGAVFHIPLHVDRNHACAIQVKHGLIIQLQADAQENLLITSKIVEVPPGKFRENVLAEALKANSSSEPLVGIFCYAKPTNHLFLYQRYPFDVLSGEMIAGLISPFMELAESWRDAILAGKSAPAHSAPMLNNHPFGLKP